MKLLNIGSLNYDYVYQVDHMVTGGETQASYALERFCGGKGLNQSLALAKAGVAVYHGGIVGEDGADFLNLCREAGVDSRFIATAPGHSGHAIIQVDRQGQNAILLHGGTNQALTQGWIDTVLAQFEQGDILLLQNEVNMIKELIDSAYEKGMTIVLNPSPLNESLLACDLSKVSLFLMNEIEGAQITGAQAPELILQEMSRRYPKARVVLTLGGDGVWYQENGKRYSQDIYKVNVVDTTAAGDTFTGYFLAGLLEGMSVQENLSRSAKAAAIAVSRKGATTSIPSLEEVETCGF